MYHGISAYNKAKAASKEELLSRVKALVGPNEYNKVYSCWSDKPLGPVGVFADPNNLEITEAYPHDGMTFVDDRTGYRYSNEHVFEYLIQEDGEDNFAFYKRVSSLVNTNANKKSSRYAEFIVCDGEADCVWYNPSYGRKWYLRAKRLAKDLGLPLMSV